MDQDSLCISSSSAALFKHTIRCEMENHFLFSPVGVSGTFLLVTSTTLSSLPKSFEYSNIDFLGCYGSSLNISDLQFSLFNMSIKTPTSLKNPFSIVPGPI